MIIKGIDSQLLKDRRKEQGRTQKDIAKAVGVSESSYKFYETGRQIPEYDIIKAIAETLEISVHSVIIRSTKVITFGQNKGGCGKTSICAGVIQVLANKGYKVLAIDGDPQKHLNKSFSLDVNDRRNLYRVMLYENETMEDNTVLTDDPNIDFVQAHHDASMIDLQLMNEYHRETIFKRKLQPIIDKGVYDFVLIDSNPVLSMMNYNLYSASDKIIIPVEPTPFGVEGLDPFMKYFNQVKKTNPQVEILGIVFTMVDSRESISDVMMSYVKKVFEDVRIFTTIIPSDTKVKQAQANDTNVVKYAENSRASKALHNFTEEVLRCLETNS